MAEPDESQARSNEISGEMPTPLAVGSASMHELFRTHVGAGFSEAQSLWILGCQITGCPGKFPPPD